MHKRIVVTLAILAVSASVFAGCKKESPQQTEAPPTTAAPAEPAPVTPAAPAPGTTADTGATGEQLFKQHCVACHPDGGNTMNKEKTLGAKGMAERSKITKPEDIVKVMRNPGKGMPKYDEATIPNSDATKIGEYILATFP